MNRTKKVIKRKTKKEIFAAWGIEYKAGKIYHPILGWIRVVLKKGNGKLGFTIYTFSTLAGTREYRSTVIPTCAIHGTCGVNCKGCYAQLGRYVFPNVVDCNARHTFLAIADIDFLKRAILAQIEADRIETVRIHASGDFMSLEYIEMWREICLATPSVTYWTYTKYAPAEHAFDDIPNCNVIPSVIPGHGLNYGTCAHILETYEALIAAGESVYICRCGIDKNQHCENCTGCTKHKYVLFIEHSTAYKAEQDPLFDKLKAVIEAQPKQ